MPQPIPDPPTESYPAACPLICAPTALLRWLLPRFPHAARAALLILGALLLAALFNVANPLGIRWRPAPDGRVGIPRAYESRLPQINLEEALRIFQSHQALFVDSRDRKDYDKDHIPGAINLPQRKWVEVWPEMRSQLPRDRTLLLYCYGGHCGLSTRQGKRLLSEGYDSFLILDHGWEGWTKAGFPTERHPEGNAA